MGWIRSIGKVGFIGNAKVQTIFYCWLSKSQFR